MSKVTLRNTLLTTICLLLLTLTPVIVRAQAEELKIPLEVREFIGSSDHAIALESADLNGDGTADYILVTEKAMAKINDEEADSERTLMILTRRNNPGGEKLTLVKSNNQVVYCKSCGGAFGDPFDSIEAKRRQFTVVNYGGSAWRWSEIYQFNYSRRDKTWQLVRAVSNSFNSLNPNKIKTKVRTPKNFGKVDIADFDVEKLNKSSRRN